MELRTIAYFLTVAEEGSLRAAARKLGLTQPALSKAVRRLEDEIGASLFDRRARGVELTVYGRSFHRHAQALHANMTDAQSEMNALRRGTAGLVRLGAGPSFLARIVPDALRTFRRRHPDVVVQVSGGLDDALKASLRAGRLDLVFAALPDDASEPDLDRRSLMIDDYRVIADRDHPLRRRPAIALADLLDYPWILPNAATHMVRRLAMLFGAVGLPVPQPVIETDIVPMKLQLIRGTDYVSFHAVAHLRTMGATGIDPLPVPAASWTRRAGVILRHGIEPNPAAQALIALVEADCRRHGGRLPPAI
ncbi:MAG: LysR family transcriptional regulator [Inquilinaceae bacterium]